jgi:hypothetical protein
MSDVMLLQNNACENTFVFVTQKQFNTDMLALHAIALNEHHAHFTSAGHSTFKSLDPDIDPDQSPENFTDAMSSKDRQEWTEALNEELCGIQELQSIRYCQQCQAAKRSKDPGLT